jgi:formylglycine-generating enzyme required for sulfatase activity
MDRWEYPNRIGEKPWVLTSWRDAVKRCAEQEKRLCTEDEFNFACEGPEMLPHVYGFARDAEKCNIDKPYKKREGKMRHYEKCLADKRCSEAFGKLDQRHAIGEDLACVSWAGIYDLNGNVNEWVELPGQKPPDRSGLKGGWWGPVRNRCRPTVTFHKEEDYGYEAGFRCCKDARL